MKNAKKEISKEVFEHGIRIFPQEHCTEAWDEGDRIFDASREMLYREVSDTSLLYFMKTALSSRDENGLVNLLPRCAMPGDARVGIVWQPTYATIALAIYLKNKLGEEATSWMDATLRPMMEKAFSHGIVGHGYDAGDMMRRTMLMLCRAGARRFLEKHPDYSPAFNKCITIQLFRIENALAEDRPSYAGGNSGCPLLGEIAAAWYGKKYPIFVYGTLRSGRSAEAMIPDAVYGGLAMLRDFELYDLGAFPGIVPSTGKRLIGEVLFVDDEELAILDRYEGEGTLYDRKTVSVKIEGHTRPVQTYVYRGSVEGRPAIAEWQPNENDTVWYACYGSNLDSERFRCYIQGGICEQNGKAYSGCRDKKLWTDSKVWRVPGRVYFGNESSGWGGKGVAFFAPDQTGEVIVRLYRITMGQLMDIRRQEGASDHWYGNMVLLDTDNDGIPAYTLTSKDIRPQREPGEAYLSLIRTALANECRMGKAGAENYLKKCLEKL